jgi:hypothetical protein
MNFEVVLDIRGRLRVRYYKVDLKTLGHLMEKFLESPGVYSVTFNQLTGSLLVLYEKSEATRLALLNRIYDPQGMADVTLVKSDEPINIEANLKSEPQNFCPVHEFVYEPKGRGLTGVFSTIGTLKSLHAVLKFFGGGKHGLICRLFH